MGMPSFSMALRDRIDIPMAALDNMFVDEKGKKSTIRGRVCWYGFHWARWKT